MTDRAIVIIGTASGIAGAGIALVAVLIGIFIFRRQSEQARDAQSKVQFFEMFNRIAHLEFVDVSRTWSGELEITGTLINKGPGAVTEILIIFVEHEDHYSNGGPFQQQTQLAPHQTMSFRFALADPIPEQFKLVAHWNDSEGDFKRTSCEGFLADHGRI